MNSTTTSSYHPHNEPRESHSNRSIVIKIIQSFPGIRYNDLIRVTGLNNGTLSHHLSILEKTSVIRILRFENSNITRYFTASVTTEEAIIVGFLKIKSTHQIIDLLLNMKQLTFVELVHHTKKTASTTSWNLRRLVDANILIRTKVDHSKTYRLRNPELIVRLKNKSNNTLFDRTIDSFSTMIDEL